MALLGEPPDPTAEPLLEAFDATHTRMIEHANQTCYESRLDQVNNRASYIEFIPDTIRLISNQSDIHAQLNTDTKLLLSATSHWWAYCQLLTYEQLVQPYHLNPPTQTSKS